jgi:hypothetical protein
MDFALVILAAVVGAGGDGAAALADRATFPPDRQPFLFYVTTATAAEDNRLSQERALRLVVPSMSRQPILERAMPIKVGPTLWRLDLLELGWPLPAFYRLTDRYPYNPAGGRALVMRSDWLVTMLTDQQEFGVYYDLVFGKAPKTRDEALAILRVDRSLELRFGMAEGRSGVAKNKERTISNLPAARGYAYGTEDVLAVDAKRDPLNRLLPGEGKHDGEEWIIGVPKIHLASGTRGALQVYFLADGAGKIVARAPVDLVEDWTEFRGLREIRNAGSCINCHSRGLNLPTENSLRVALEAGVELKSLHPQNEQIEAFHLSNLDREMRRDLEDYEAIVGHACGCTPVEASAAYQSAVTAYDEEVTLETAAREFYIEAEEVPLALAWATRSGYNLGPRFAMLAEGLSIPRDAFEELYRPARAMIDKWRLSK